MDPDRITNAGYSDDDADIEVTKDERLIVRISYKIIQILGI